MTERKPEGIPWETFIDRQIREAEKAGTFDNLPGTGKPLPGLDRPYEELWWIKDFLKREGINLLPGSLALRKEVETALEATLRLHTETEVRTAIETLNLRIRRGNAEVLDGPPTQLAGVDPEAVLLRWRTLRADHDHKETHAH